MVVAGEVGFLLREKLTEFLVPIRWTRFCQTIFWGYGFGKTETDFFGGNSDLVFRAEEGSGEESARIFRFEFFGVSALIWYNKFMELASPYPLSSTLLV